MSVKILTTHFIRTSSFNAIFAMNMTCFFIEGVPKFNRGGKMTYTKFSQVGICQHFSSHGS